MLTTIRAFCLGLIAATATIEPKESTIPVVEVSHVGAPLRISGLVTAKDCPSEKLRYSFETQITIANVSRKPILLTIVKLDVISTLKVRISDYSEEDDYFFESKILQPNSNAKLEVILGPFGEPQGPYEPRGVEAVEPTAQVRVAFVQFLDGSTWGDAAAAKRALLERRRSLEELEVLANTYRLAGEHELLNRLLQPTLLQPIMALQKLYREKQDVTLVLARLDEMLKNAHVHGS